MSKRFQPWKDVPDRAYRIAVLLGLASIPITAVLYWQSPGTVTGTPILLAGLLVGLLYHDRPVSSARAGAVTGVVGSSVLLWPFVEMVAFISGLSQPGWFSVLQVGVAINFVILGAGFLGLAGAISAWIGDRVTGRLRQRSSSATAS